jgi:Ca2+-binding EF-hand superfamily protein
MACDKEPSSDPRGAVRMPSTTQGSQNQTLLELIYAVKSLAQQIDLFHQDLSRRLDEETRTRRNDLARVLDLSGKNLQSLSVLPITLSDRVEKLLARLESNVDGQIDEVKSAINELREALQEYNRTADRAISQNEITAAVEAVQEKHQKEDITGRIELTEKGEVHVSLNSRVLKKIWYGVVVLATGGGAYGLVELVKHIFGWAD